MATTTGTAFDCMYPDLLSREGLLFTLKKRYVQIPQTDLESRDKDSLVELYNRYILPLPQRKYRENLRGREMKRAQIVRDKKRKFTVADDVDFSLMDNQKKGRLSSHPSGPSRGLVNNFHSTNSSGDRLKPPPSCIDTSKTVVKLSTTSSPPSSTKTQESPPGKTVIKLGGDANSNGTVKRAATNNIEGSETSPKKKFSKIAWP